MSRRARSGRIEARREGGFALLLVLWAVTLLALIATAFATTTRTNTLVVRNTVDNTIARALADAGIAYGILGFLAAADGGIWPADGSARDITMKTGSVRVSIQDEGGKIDLNAATEDLLTKLFVSVGVDGTEAASLVDAIADFRDPDDRVRPNGAETHEYRSAGLDRQPRNEPFTSVQGVLDVLGMNADIYARIAPFITVYSGTRTVNPMTAPPQVLLALSGMSESAADDFMATRAEAGSQSTIELLSTLGASEFEFSVNSVEVVSIVAEGKSATGGRFVREAIVDLSADSDSGLPYRIVAWSQRFDSDQTQDGSVGFGGSP